MVEPTTTISSKQKACQVTKVRSREQEEEDDVDVALAEVEVEAVEEAEVTTSWRTVGTSILKS
jgi:hypothetical protein